MKLITYVDGSYSAHMHKYSYGCILLLPSGEIVKLSGSQKDRTSMCNVSGELVAAMQATRWAKTHHYSEIEIFYDYDGIRNWYTGDWTAKKEETQDYKKYMKLLAKQIKITFTKVTAHTGNKYNEMADALAKQALKEKS